MQKAACEHSHCKRVGLVCHKNHGLKSLHLARSLEQRPPGANFSCSCLQSYLSDCEPAKPFVALCKAVGVSSAGLGCGLGLAERRFPCKELLESSRSRRLARENYPKRQLCGHNGERKLACPCFAASQVYLGTEHSGQENSPTCLGSIKSKVQGNVGAEGKVATDCYPGMGLSRVSKG